MFLRMLSYYISWHMRSNAAPNKAARRRTPDDYPVHSFTSLLADLATICANQIQPTTDLPAFTMITTRTPLQQRALQLLDVSHRHGTRRQHTNTKPQVNPTNRPKPEGTSA